MPGVPGRLLLLLAGFELGLGLGFGLGLGGWTWAWWWTKEVALMVELGGGTEKVSSDIIFEEKKNCVS